MLRTILLALALLCLAPARAHNFHAGLSELSFNPRTGSTEVVHTLMAHDVDLLMLNLYQRQPDYGDPDDEAALRRYVEEHFYLLGKDGKRLPLKWVGVKPEVDSITVFAEAEHTPLAAIARVHDGLLGDFLRDQVNTVNVRQDGKVRTLTFTADKTELPLD